MKKSEGRLNFAWQVAVMLAAPLYYLGVVFAYDAWCRIVLGKRRRIILTYHRVHDGAEDPEMSVTPEHFRQHMDFLSQRYKVVSLGEILHPSVADRNEDLVAITFDDGFVDNFEQAYPVLKEQGFPAIIFLIADRIAARDPAMLTLDQIGSMTKNSISFGSHTCSHPVLAHVPPSVAEEEIRRSKEILEKMLGVPVEYFAYPKGKKEQVGPLAKDIVKASGYKAAVTMENGDVSRISDIFEIGRLGVRDVPLIVFKTRLSGIFESAPFLLVRQILGAT